MHISAERRIQNKDIAQTAIFWYNKFMRVNNFLKLIICVVVCELAGIIGSFFTISAIPVWYATLQKPFLNPPGWVFGPVWTTLYLLMGISLWLIWKSDSKEKKKAIWLFLLQLVLNAIWSPLFFGARSIGEALAVIVLLWAAIVLTILVFTKISKVAAYLLIPYILWVSFATYLNFALWVLN
jgi:tryptophan-rich sensory protein